VAYPGVDEDADFPKKGYAMKDDTVVALRQPGSFSDDPLTDILRAGARQLLAQAIEAEVEGHIAAHADLTDARGRRRIVRHGYLPEREIQTGIGAVRVQAPRVRDRDPADGRIRFTSSILPRYLRRTKSVEELLPWLYLKGISTGDFGEALAALLGVDAPGLAASTIGRLKALWWDEYEAWRKRDLSARRYVYFWADGVYFSPRMEHDKQCVLVIIGADERGHKDIIGMVDGYRESAQSWKELLLDLKRRGLEAGPELAAGDGALGFWKALREVYGQTREQRCWVHKTANVLNQMPKSLQARAKGHLQDIWMAETKAGAEKAFDFFITAYGAKYDKAVERLIKDRERLLTFYDFPAEHWKHIRTTNPIESTFATVRLRTVKTKGCLSRKTALAMTFKLILSAREKWRKLDGSSHLAELIEGVPFKDGIKQIKYAA
jgi:transposase-like protein